ncbi:uncharacterized protein LOC103313696 [Tribolium castaneum]|uniref:Uncharacterized protein n=1 Tax=Tribolium castaneum TaxID=7070 RepID=D6WQM5_TRICA|nr:PREDICTED: uncharacterized protein LOC103313696 [Tribolium castaneum]EFA06053.1 hypothetical protein TcasGA2_TC008888 [Tribolium castaneum]|eukprot:XP_008195865.1 PREDICTED: uncharacterized protein LOC103313696 [Tribolium castaneum]
MYTKLFALFALLAAANASAIFYPQTKIADVAVAKTSIVGPAGNITKEEHVPVITHEPAAFVANPVFRYLQHPVVLGGDAVVHQHEVSVVHPPVLPFHPVVHHEVPVVPTVPHNVVLKTIPHTLPYAAPFTYTPHFYSVVNPIKLVK